MDVQNSFCIYIWHPVQKTGWFLGYASGYAIGYAAGYAIEDGSADGIGYASGYMIGDASVDEARDATVYPCGYASAHGIVSGSVNARSAPCMLTEPSMTKDFRNTTLGIGAHLVPVPCTKRARKVLRRGLVPLR